MHVRGFFMREKNKINETTAYTVIAYKSSLKMNNFFVCFKYLIGR